MPTGTQLLLLNPCVVARTLAVTAFLLIVASIATQCVRFGLGYDYAKGLVPLLYVDNEQNIPTFFSALILLFAALLLAAVAALNSKSRAPYVLKWAALSLIFTCLAYDELFEIHEGIEILNEFVETRIVIAIVLAVFFWKFLLHLPTKIRTAFIVAFAIYTGGAVGVDLTAEYYAELHGETFIYTMIATIEESLEMAGVIVFIWTLLKYCEDKYKQVQFRIGT